MFAKECIIAKLIDRLNGDALLDLVKISLDDDKAEDLVVIDLAGKSTIGDFMVVATGRSQRQVAAMADHLVVKLKQSGIKDAAIEGKTQGDWVLIDAGDVIVHLFRPEVREFYGIEKMWMVDPVSSSHQIGTTRGDAMAQTVAQG
ncbi:ribosome silencing factor [Alphaproteobacteria bacterium]|nr:ribosome silencing factor [Alphaproteobacteria bacterium]